MEHNGNFIKATAAEISKPRLFKQKPKRVFCFKFIDRSERSVSILLILPHSFKILYNVV